MPPIEDRLLIYVLYIKYILILYTPNPPSKSKVLKYADDEVF